MEQHVANGNANGAANTYFKDTAQAGVAGETQCDNGTRGGEQGPLVAQHHLGEVIRTYRANCNEKGVEHRVGATAQPQAGTPLKEQKCGGGPGGPCLHRLWHENQSMREERLPRTCQVQGSRSGKSARGYSA